MLEPIDASRWDARKARHLLNRAGFGVGAGRIEYLASVAPSEAVSAFVDFEQFDEGFQEPDFLLAPVSSAQVRQLNKELDQEEVQKLIRERRRDERLAVEHLKQWWLARMLNTPRPLEEKMTLFWHGHFATSAQKVQSSYQNYQLTNLFRTHAVGDFKALTIGVGQSPAMLDYLDNRKSTKRHPNENWARELMELFTMGVGNYTEDDIKESARAFTGWNTDRVGFQYQLEDHDPGEKTFLGKKGHFDGWDIIDTIFEQPVTARFICTKLWKYFASETVDEAAVEAMASILWQSNWQVRPVLAALFNSARFYDDDIIGTQVKSPAQFVVRLCEDLEFTAPPYAAMARATKAIGQDLLYPPNVKGWDGNRAWINANSLLLRYNLPVRLVQASETRKTKMAADAMMDPDAQAPMMEEAMMSEGSDSKPMEDYADAPVIGPSREERTAYLQESRREAMRRIRQLPPEQQRGMRERFRDSRGAERLQVLSELGIDSPEWATPGPVRMFDNLTFDTAGGCIDALQQRFVSVPFSPTQRPELLKILNTRDESMPLRAENIGPQQRIALLRIIASMAEYQLC